MTTSQRRRSNAASPQFGLNYAAIGATASEDVLSFPPPGFRSTQFHHRIGSGTRRFDIAGRALMTWGVLRGAGIRVDDVEAEFAPSTSSPAAKPKRGGRENGPLFLEDGTPWITPGMTATLVLLEKPVTVKAPVKVVWVIDEPGRIGYAYGSCPGHPAQVEQFILLEHAPDDSVWLTTRSIARCPGPAWKPAAAVFRMRQKQYDRRFLTALHPAHATAVATA